MTTSEFIRRVEQMGYDVDPVSGIIFIGAATNVHTYNINRFAVGEVDNSLVDLIVEYTRTPIEDREEEERYLWVLRGKEKTKHLGHFFNLVLEDLSWFIGEGVETPLYKTTFTEDEFSKLEEEFDIKGMFIRERVNDENN